MEYKNPGRITFEASVISSAVGGGAHIISPLDVEEMYREKSGSD